MLKFITYISMYSINQLLMFIKQICTAIILVKENYFITSGT